MSKKLVLLAVSLAFSAPAFAQAAQDNPFMEMARKFVEGRDFWQDEKFQHAYDAYFDCYEKLVSEKKASSTATQVTTDALFHSAYTSCELLRVAGTKAAHERITEFHPDMAADERAKRTDQYRRNLAVLRLGDSFKKIGLGDAYSDYFDRTTEY